MSLPTVDWIFAAVLLASLVLGAWRGLVYEVLSAVNWVVAFFLAQWLAPDVASRLPLASYSEAIQYAAGFLVVFVGSVLVGSLVALLGQKLFAVVGLRPADRALGAAFGLVRGLAILMAATLLVGMTPLKDSESWRASVGVGFSTAALKGLQPLLPQAFGRYLPS
jgi:membrane protein required for colicin V production